MLTLLLISLFALAVGEPLCVTQLKNGGFENNVQCSNNDTYCGEWNDRVFTPLGCKYRDVTVDQALKCMANRTIACVGDSQIESLCTAMGFFLLGFTEYDDILDNFWKEDYSMYMDSLKLKDPPAEGKFDWGMFSTALPAENTKEFGDITWQTITAGLRTLESMLENLPIVLSNKFQGMLTNNDGNAQLRHVDIAFVNAGLHSKPYFNTTPYGEHYFTNFVQPWIDIVDKVEVPSIWAGMNNECPAKLDPRYSTTSQATMVEEANWYTHKRLHELKLPYFDLGGILRTPQRCEIQLDGLHMHRWANVINSKIIFNYLCDDNWNWIGSVKPFIGNKMVY